MHTVVLTMRGSSRIQFIQNSLNSAGISNYRIFYGINGKKSGLRTVIPYEYDAPGSGYLIPPEHLGCTVSHWILWNSLLFENSTEDMFMVVEDDAIFRPNWKHALESALSCMPDDWDILYLGSCCAADKIKNQIGPNLFEGMPFCTHCYVVRKKALETLVSTNEQFYGKVDIQMYLNNRHLLKCFTVFTRVVDQHETEISD
jgi:GR25 family glycosyltransferase involved in LPS biosynthesis